MLVLVGEPNEHGWQEVTVPVGSTPNAVSELLRLGSDLEVLSPANLREAMRKAVQTIATYYE